MSNQARNIKGNHGIAFSPAPDDDSGSVGEAGGCTLKQDAFALALADTGNQAAAYRVAYHVTDNTSLNTIYAAASRVANLPHVRKRTAEYREKFAIEAMISVREAFQWRLDIATADPSDLAYVAKRSCRHCHGVDHKYQWRDEDEYVQALAKAMDDNSKAPSDAGGYGYSRAREPATECPECLGNGTEEVVTNDIRKVTGKARKLFAGLDYKSGQWVMKFHDQARAWSDVLEMMGLLKGTGALDLKTPGERATAAAIPEGLSEADTARAYLALIG